MDTNNLFALGKHEAELGNFKGELLFIDHHAPREGMTDSVKIFNDESYNSTASIVYAAMKKVGVEMKRETAILLLNGIIADSADLQNSFPETFRQVAELLDVAKVEFSFFSDFVNKGVPVRNKYQVIKDIFEAKAEVIGDHLLIYGRATEHANVAADTALKLDADITLFWVTSGTEASISARMRPPLDKELSINLGVLMKDIGVIVGGNGGGHACAAGAYGPKREAAQEAGEAAVRKIKEKLVSAMHK
jgi:nanoRNase/pAp phosphatase (c-di-AMP/oligoRNAs hydrolase)